MLIAQMTKIFNQLFYTQLHQWPLGIRKKLEVHGRARREAARRRKSEHEVNLAIRNSSRSNGSWQITPTLYRFLS